MKYILVVFVLMWNSLGNAGIFDRKQRQTSPMQKTKQQQFSAQVNQSDNSLIIIDAESSEVEASLSLNDYKHEDHNESFVSEIVYSSDQNSFAVIFGFSELGESNPYKFGYKEIKEKPIQLCLVVSLERENLGEVTNQISLQTGLHKVLSLSKNSISFSSPYPHIGNFNVELNLD